jgi:putative sensor protein
MMALTDNDVTVQPALLPRPSRVPLRLFLLGRSAVVMVTSMIGVVLFSLWITLVAISPITIFAPLVLPVTVLVRRYADAHRRDARRLAGTSVIRAYREPQRSGLVHRVWTVERDPASWRDARWLLLHAIVACFTSALSFSLFAGILFYLSYPFLFLVTPQHVFGRPFGGLIEFHTAAQACAMMPLALLAGLLWYLLAIPLARAEVSLTRTMLGC